MNRPKRFLFLALIVLLSLVLFFSAYKIIVWQRDSSRTSQDIELVHKVANLKEDNDFLKISWSDLKKINQEIIGYLKIKNTKIDYPFVKTINNTFYLNHSLDKTRNEAGWVFMDYRNSFNDQNIILYAHARKDLTLFGSLKNTLKKDWFLNEDNLIIQTAQEQESALWKIFSIYVILDTDDYIATSFSKEEFNDFIKLIKKRSIYNFSTHVATGDQVLTLSTCYSDIPSKKLVVHAKKVNSIQRNDLSFE